MSQSEKPPQKQLSDAMHMLHCDTFCREKVRTSPGAWGGGVGGVEENKREGASRELGKLHMKRGLEW